MTMGGTEILQEKEGEANPGIAETITDGTVDLTQGREDTDELKKPKTN
jgi:hypothetical protein